MKIKLLKAEGDWIQTTLGCYISVNNNLLDVITPLNSPHEISSIDVPTAGMLRLVIRDMGKSDGYLASLSISLELLTPESQLWLPLQSSPSIDTIIELNNNIQSPRLMISVFNDFGDDEIFQTSQEIDSDSISEIVLASEIAVSKEPENILLKTSHFNNIHDSNDKKQQEIIDILSLEIENFQQIIAREKEINENLKSRISNILLNVKQNNERAADRENSLIELVSEKENEINKVMEMNRKLQNIIRKIEFDKKNSDEKYERASSQLEFMKSLEKELTFYKDALKTSENNVEKLSATIIGLAKSDNQEKNGVEIIGNSNNCIVNGGKTDNLETLVKENNIESLTERKNEESWSQQICIKNFLQNAFEKITEINEIFQVNEFVYKVNDIEIVLAITNDGIYARSGSNLMTVEEFWNNRGKRAVRHSEIPIITNKLICHAERGGENDSKRPTSKISPKKSILKSVCNTQKYTSVLSKSPIKEIKLTEKKKLNK